MSAGKAQEVPAYEAEQPKTGQQKPHYKLDWEDVRPVELMDHVIRLQRLRHFPLTRVLAPSGGALLAAAIGAVIQGAAVTAKGVLLAGAVGAVLLLAGWLAYRDRTENLDNLCEDLFRFIDRWDPMEDGYETNSAYVRAAASNKHTEARSRN